MFTVMYPIFAAMYPIAFVFGILNWPWWAAALCGVVGSMPYATHLVENNGGMDAPGSREMFITSTLMSVLIALAAYGVGRGTLYLFS